MREVTVNIKGIQHTGSSSDCIEYFTIGKFSCRDGHFLISYDDSASFGINGITTTLKIDGDKKVILQRSGALKSRLTVEKGQRNLCHYNMEFGSAMLGVFGKSIRNELTKDGGRLYMSYTLDINSSLLSKNELEISVGEV